MDEHTPIKNGSVLLPEELKRRDVEITAGVILSVERNIPARESTDVIDARGKYVLPVFMDIHTNGRGRFDPTIDVYDLVFIGFPSNGIGYLNGLDNTLMRYARTGVTRAVMIRLASPVSDLTRVLRYISNYRDDFHKQAWSDVLDDPYVGGTFVKRLEYRGAKNSEHFNEPFQESFDEMQKTAGGLIRIVNVVPEQRADALDLIKVLGRKRRGQCHRAYGRYRCAIFRSYKDQAKTRTQFLNSPSGSSVKPLQGGARPKVCCGATTCLLKIITSGYYVAKFYVMDNIERKGFDKIVVITDTMFPTLLEESYKFSMLGIQGKVSLNMEYFHISDRGDAVFRGTLTMDKVFPNIPDWPNVAIEGVWHKVRKHLSFKQALSKASHMRSGSPARVIGNLRAGTPGDRSNLSRFTKSIEEGRSANAGIPDIKVIHDSHRVRMDRVFVKDNPSRNT
jgi:N-acetylglucosamine-6-phosphate deacetylase